MNMGLIVHTARDYDMEIWEVEAIYNQTGGDEEFYPKLEEFILERRNK